MHTYYVFKFYLTYEENHPGVSHQMVLNQWQPKIKMFQNVFTEQSEINLFLIFRIIDTYFMILQN